MATVHLVEYETASPAVRQVYDDIMTTRKIDWVNNFWKALAVQPELLRRTWAGVKSVMAPGQRLSDRGRRSFSVRGP